MYDNNDKVTKSVADAARRIMEGQEPEVLNEALKGDQHKIDKNKNNKVDAEDFKILRGEKKVEEAAGASKEKETKFHSKLDKLVHKTFGKRPEEMKEETEELTESHFKVGDEVVCKASGMEGEVVKVDPKGEGKYYTVKREDGKMMKYAPDELKLEDEDEDEEEKDDMNEGVKTQVAKGRTRNVGTYGQAKGADFGGTDWDKEESGKEEKPKRAKYGSRQNYVRSKRVNESFTDLLESYTEGGIKSLLQSLNRKEETIEEESTNDEFKAEIKKAQDKSEGREKAEVAKAKVDAVENVKEEVEKHTFVAVHAKKGMHQTQGSTSYEAAKNAAAHWKMKSTAGIDVHRADKTHVAEEVELEERTLTEPEMKKKEEVVKGMKKNLSSFKDRYGDRAKEVMYATATKLAKEEVEDHWRKGYHHVREPISDEPYLDNARGRFNELKKNNPHKKGTPEHKEWHSGASAAYEEHKDMLKGN